MTESNQSSRDKSHADDKDSPGSPPKKPYVKPAFRYEKVFETMALACGKTGVTVAQCRLNRKNS